jgi:Zn-finger nucleic acid-binding protein
MTLEPLTLKEAAERYRFKLATLRHEAKEGRLAVYKIGKAHYTTPADIQAMVEKCRVQQDRISTLTAAETPSASGMVLDQSELDAVLETRLAPKRNSLNTSRANTDRRQRQALGSGT